MPRRARDEAGVALEHLLPHQGSGVGRRLRHLSSRRVRIWSVTPGRRDAAVGGVGRSVDSTVSEPASSRWRTRCVGAGGGGDRVLVPLDAVDRDRAGRRDAEHLRRPSGVDADALRDAHVSLGGAYTTRHIEPSSAPSWRASLGNDGTRRGGRWMPTPARRGGHIDGLGVAKRTARHAEVDHGDDGDRDEERRHEVAERLARR
jgi:hypothetical protein